MKGLKWAGLSCVAGRKDKWIYKSATSIKYSLRGSFFTHSLYSQTLSYCPLIIPTMNILKGDFVWGKEKPFPKLGWCCQSPGQSIWAILNPAPCWSVSPFVSQANRLQEQACSCKILRMETSTGGKHGRETIGPWFPLEKFVLPARCHSGRTQKNFCGVSCNFSLGSSVLAIFSFFVCISFLHRRRC